MNKSRKQHPTKNQLYGHLPPICKTIQIRWTRHVGHCWRSKDELISNVLLWTLSHRRASVGPPARTYLQQFCANTGSSLENQPERCTIETSGDGESGKSMLAAQHTYIYNYYTSMTATIIATTTIIIIARPIPARRPHLVLVNKKEVLSTITFSHSSLS